MTTTTTTTNTTTTSLSARMAASSGDWKHSSSMSMSPSSSHHQQPSPAPAPVPGRVEQSLQQWTVQALEGTPSSRLLAEQLQQQHLDQQEEAGQGHPKSQAPRLMGPRTLRKVLRVKGKHRTDLDAKEWGKYRHSEQWSRVREELPQQLRALAKGRSVPRVHVSELTLESFHERFERQLKPCLVVGAMDDWPAKGNWGFAALRAEFGERPLKCGEDDDGYSVKLKLKHFLRYQCDPSGARKDDSPLYVFDSAFDNNPVTAKLLEDYKIPAIFSEDLFGLVGEKRRPPYRWWLVGPERSGTTVHIDPLGTSAWNALARGRKLWVLFPPHLSKKLLKGKEFIAKGRDDEPIDWFADILPRMLRHYGDELQSEMSVVVQVPGEIIYVPSGWWHAVLNLDDTVAVTQNYCSSANFEKVWCETRSGRKKMALRWLEHLDERRPDLARFARQLNKRDSYDMHAELAKYRERRDAKKKRKADKAKQKGKD